jgi:GPI mannosyltransferase 3
MGVVMRTSLRRLMKRPLLVWLLIGLVLRLGFSLVSDHIYYPDEVFQVLEPAHRLAFGYGIIPWEYEEGVRHFGLPLFYGAVLSGLNFVGIDDPTKYRSFLAMITAIFSLSLIWSVYQIGAKWFKSKEVAVLAAAATAIWYELIYFSPRPFFEMIATYVIYGAWALTLVSNRAITLVLAGAMLGYSILLRPQYLLFVVGLLIIELFSRRQIERRKTLLMGMVAGLLIGGVIDWLTLGSLFQSVQTYLVNNLARGSELLADPVKLGNEGRFFYISALLIASGGMVLVSVVNYKKYWPLWGLILAVLLPHTLIDHKEYRFIFVLLPLWLMLSINSLIKITKSSRLTMLVVILVSLLGALRLLPFQDRLYLNSFLKRSDSLAIYSHLANDPALCGLMDANASWVLTGGYYYLHQDVPLYSLDYPPADLESVNRVIAIPQGPEVEGFKLGERFGELAIYQREGGCREEAEYQYTRPRP